MNAMFSALMAKVKDAWDTYNTNVRSEQVFGSLKDPEIETQVAKLRQHMDKEINPVDTDFSVLVRKHAKRLGVDERTAISNMEAFASTVGYVENNNETYGNNPYSSAKGLYQITDIAIDETINRLSRTLGMTDWMKDAMQHLNANRLSREQQTLLFTAQMLELEGTDPYIKRIMETGDENAMRDAYMRFWHTKPDASVYRNWARGTAKRTNHGG